MVSLSGVVEPVDGFRGLEVQLLSSAVVQLLEQVCGRMGHGLGLGAADISFGSEGGHDGFSENGDLGAEGEGFLGCLIIQELVDSVEQLCVEFLRGASVEAIDGDILALLGEERKAVGHGQFGDRYGLEFGGVQLMGCGSGLGGYDQGVVLEDSSGHALPVKPVEHWQSVRRPGGAHGA